MGIKVNGNEPACLARTAAASILGIAAACNGAMMVVSAKAKIRRTRPGKA
jgi:hypothetical protein